MKQLIYLDRNSEDTLYYGRWHIPPGFRPRKSLAIAFSRKNGHAYLVAGKYEIHGHFIFKKIWLREFTPRSCRPLVYVHFPTVTEKDVEKLEKYLEKIEGSRDFTCIRFITRSLEECLDIRMNLPFSDMYPLEDHFCAFLEHGFSREAKPLSHQIYLTEKWSITSVIEHLRALDNRFAWLGVLSWYVSFPFWPLKKLLQLPQLIRRGRAHLNPIQRIYSRPQAGHGELTYQGHR